MLFQPFDLPMRTTFGQCWLFFYQMTLHFFNIVLHIEDGIQRYFCIQNNIYWKKNFLFYFKVNILSPSILSLHDEGRETEKLLSISNLMQSFLPGDRSDLMDLITDISGISDAVEKARVLFFPLFNSSSLALNQENCFFNVVLVLFISHKKEYFPENFW